METPVFNFERNLFENHYKIWWLLNFFAGAVILALMILAAFGIAQLAIDLWDLFFNWPDPSSLV